ncbi:MAG TPA: hypothetical protein VK359_05500, partial [Rubrobacteraceae bacterium]|nr:hypothetical protein [Rubrobacteraceae bacterium]
TAGSCGSSAHRIGNAGSPVSEKTSSRRLVNRGNGAGPKGQTQAFCAFAAALLRCEIFTKKIPCIYTSFLRYSYLKNYQPRKAGEKKLSNNNEVEVPLWA